jgi:chemotaxis protein methyltransferase CheR
MIQGRGAEVDRFRGVVVRRLGLQFDDGKVDFLAGVLHRRLAATRLDADGYLDRLTSDAGAGEVAALAPELTVPETYFFRHAAQFRALTGRALPDRVAARRDDRRLQLLSAGCATGEEAYSLAMATRDVVPAAWDVRVRGVDVNRAVIERARRGRYTEWALRETPAAMERRWFTRRGRECQLDPAIRDAVRFDARNLIEDDPELWAPGSYDIVFLRNVLMYFEPAQARAVMARVERALRPGGFLFLGHAETIRGLSTAFVLCHTDDAFYYQRGVASPAAAATWDEPPVAAGGAGPRPGETWIDVVHRTTLRIEHLVDPATGAAPSPATVSSPVRTTTPAVRPIAYVPADGARWDLDAVRACLRDERYVDAAAALAALPAAAAADPEVLLHAAVVEAHRGRLAEAEMACERLLRIDAFNAGAHYLLALRREAAGDHARAEHHDQVAIYLDPTFAMAHLHLGLQARRRGDRDTARRTLEHAATLLQRESEARLLLFGGGFTRESLVALCRTEIDRLEQSS